MATGTIRPRKDGGCSLCKASEENVGKRRCCHMLGGTTMSVVHKNGMNYVDISGTLDHKDKIHLTAEVDEQTIHKMLAELTGVAPLPEKEKKNILKSIRAMEQSK